MRHSPTAAALLVILQATLCLAADNLLLNPGAEQGKNDQPSIWFAAQVAAPELKMTRDTQTAHSGKASFCIDNAHAYDQPTANNWAQNVHAVAPGTTLLLGGWIKTADADSANICLQCWDADGKEMLAFASTPVVRGDQDWIELHGDAITVPRGTASIIVRAALGGKGKVWFDDITLTESQGPATNPAAGPAAAAPAEVAPSPQSLDKDLLASIKGEVVAVIPIDRDQMVLSYMPDWAYGRVDNIAVANNMGGVRTFFAWPAIDKKFADHKFILACYSRDTRSAADPGEIGAYEVLGEWNEQTSWQKAPKTADQPAATFAFVPNNGWKTFDVTALANKSHGVVLRFSTEDKTAKNWSGYQFPSREAAADWQSRRPMLLVVK